MHHSPTKSDIEFIGIDWGVNNFRAYAIDAEGVVKQRAKAHQGIHRIKDENYVNTLKRLLGKWFNKYPNIPILMSGMIGSAEGWQEVEYVDGPSDLEQVAEFVEKIVNHRFDREIYIVPGVKLSKGEQIIDTLRGEEVQVLGAALLNPKATKQIICIPGLQTKWVEINQNTIVNCHTYVTGDLFANLNKHVQLENTVATNIYDVAAANLGLDLLKQGNALAHDVNTLKMLVLNGQLAPTASSSALCALLIGSEMSSAVKQLGQINQLTVIGAAWLFDLYQEVGKRFGVTINPIKTEDATARGLFQVYKNLPFQQPQANPKISVKKQASNQGLWG